MVKAIFFDFWGTLVENGTYSPMKQTYKLFRVRMPFGAFVERFEKAFMTKEWEDQATAFQEAAKEFKVELKPFIIDRLIGIWNKNKIMAALFPDTIDMLKTLRQKGIKAVIISNAPSNNIEPLLERFEMQDLIAESFISYKDGKLKTNGLFEIALKKMKLKKEDVISIGDSIQTDMRGAEKAGLKTVLLDRNMRREWETKISTLDEVPNLLE